MKVTNFAFGAVTLVIVGILVWWEFGRLTSPGPLHPTHAALKDLTGRNDCKACHGDQAVPMNDACLACHQPITAQINAATGLHGRLDPGEVVACQRCHAEHNGGAVALVSEVSFQLAGIDTPEQYRHEDIPEFSLVGAHDRLDCDSCHAAADHPMLSKGEFRFLGLSQTCTACHEDVHKGSYSTDCASCHGQSSPFETVAAFEHTPQFALAGSHSGLACLACHERGTAFSIEAEQASHPESVRSCAACHESQHTPDFLAGVAQTLGVLPLETCSACHDAMDHSFAFPEATVTKAQHAFAGFVLNPPHDEAECLQCHTPPGTIVAREDLPESTVDPRPWVTLHRAADDCRACHGDPHAGQFDPVNASGVVESQPSCLSCHTPTLFKPSAFDAARHAQTAFPLVEAHAAVACAECHVPSAGSPTVFAGTPTSCAACHEDAHAGQFAATLGNDCSICHTTASFVPSLFDESMHAETRFPLTGLHLAIACRSCHEVEHDTRRFVNTPMSCADCHEDVHRGAFDGPDMPAMIDSRTGCARCHTTERFDAVTWQGDTHERWTGFALVGQHAAASCQDCHKPNDSSDPRVYSFAKAPTSCAACHTDVHAGQFDRAGVTDCARCHNADQTFAQISFDHQTDSDFKLDATHSVLSCAECHRPASGTPVPVVRYRPIAHECRDCHGFDG